MKTFPVIDAGDMRQMFDAMGDFVPDRADKITTMLMEEAAEVIVAIAHLKRERPDALAEVREELADFHVIAALMLCAWDETMWHASVQRSIAKLDYKITVGDMAAKLPEDVADAKTVVCGQQACDQVATCRFLWPGHEVLPSCKAHADHAKNVAAKLGFVLEILPL